MNKSEQAVALQSLQHKVLEGVASGQPLKSVMGLLCRQVERLAPATICSVLAIDSAGLLQHLASPSLPEPYSRAIDGLQIGPCTGSCGTAAYRGEPVAVVDIARDPLWADYKALALPLGLKACWSSPIKARDGRVIGTFAFYYRTQRGPSALDRQIVETCVHLCAIAIEHEETQARVHDLAFRDVLTRLPNRACFQLRAAEALAAAKDTAAALAIHYVDLDDFKGVNDTLGHWVGDMLLERIAKRLASCIQDGEIVARLGGDEFAIIQAPVRSREEIAQRARGLISLFDEPFEIEHHNIRIGTSIGIVQAPCDGSDLVDLLKKADLALYRAKKEDRGSYRFFTSDMYERLRARRALEHDLRVGIGAGEFELFYQPIVTLNSNTICGMEALVRWNHPTRGRILPMEFIPVSEETGLIGRLGEWILREACTQATAWPARIKIAVNLSPRQLDKLSFVLDVVRALNTTGLSPHRLEVEITETLPLAENAGLRNILHELKQLGVGISLDDFGTGYSSLSYLRAFPFDRIKIDRAFIRDLDRQAEATSIVRAVIKLARDLGIRTTAEGVETEQQVAWLKNEGSTEGQGYYFGAPRAVAEINGLLGQAPHRPAERRSASSA